MTARNSNTNGISMNLEKDAQFTMCSSRFSDTKVNTILNLHSEENHVDIIVSFAEEVAEDPGRIS